MPNRTPDFRYLFANVIGFAWSDNDCKLMFGIDEGAGAENALEQVGIIMTHKSAKLLAKHLMLIIDGFEEHSGMEIPYDPEKAEGIRQSLRQMHENTNQVSNAP